MSKNRILVCAAGLLVSHSLVTLFIAAVQAAPSASSQVPIRLHVLRDGTHRYSVPVRVGGQSMEAGLDTGSVGLHVLARAIKSASLQMTNEPSNYAYGSGARLKGVKATGPVHIGAASGSFAFQVVQDVDCLPDKPHCPASRIPSGAYGIMGDGISGEGFAAILGIKPNADAPVPHPFFSLNVHQWLVDLPSERAGGRLILDPSPQAAKGFALLPVFSAPGTRLHDAVAGCLLNERSQEKICGAIEMDSGAPGMSVSSQDPLPAEWPPNTPAALLFQDDHGVTRAVEHFRTNQRPAMSRLTFKHEPTAHTTVIHAGISPYLAFSVLYAGDMLGFRPRPTVSNQPQGELR